MQLGFALGGGECVSGHCRARGKNTSCTWSSRTESTAVAHVRESLVIFTVTKHKSCRRIEIVAKGVLSDEFLNTEDRVFRPMLPPEIFDALDLDARWITKNRHRHIRRANERAPYVARCNVVFLLAYDVLTHRRSNNRSRWYFTRQRAPVVLAPVAHNTPTCRNRAMQHLPAHWARVLSVSVTTTGLALAAQSSEDHCMVPWTQGANLRALGVHCKAAESFPAELDVIVFSRKGSYLRRSSHGDAGHK